MLALVKGAVRPDLYCFNNFRDFLEQTKLLPLSPHLDSEFLGSMPTIKGELKE